MPMPQPDEFLTITAISSGDSFGYLFKKAQRPLSLMEKAFLVSLFDKLYCEFNEELTGCVGEDRAYLLTEYQKLAIDEFRKTVESIKKKVAEATVSLPPAHDSKLDKALETLSELDEFDEDDV